MDNYFTDGTEIDSSYFSFEQYPWAHNHKDAINCITRYMDDDAEGIVEQLNERILSKVARDHYCY